MKSLKELLKIKNPAVRDLLNVENPLQQPSEYSRRKFIMMVSIGLNGLVGLVLAAPVVGYVLAPLLQTDKGWNHWVPVGDLEQFPKGQTRLGRYRNPDTSPADGQTATLPCWVRNIDDKHFQVFAINCAHMDCPVRWFPQSKLFMCPCHGGVYYQDGSRAAGPPPRGLFQFKHKVVGNRLMIWAGEMPTLSTQASIAAPGSSPCQG